MAKKSIQKAAKARPLTIYDGEKYFDAKFTSEEREQLRNKIEDVVGEEINFYWNLERPTEKEICAALNSIGWGKYEDLYDYILIKLCRDLEIDYKSFAKNEPKIPIDSFMAFAKRMFPKFEWPRNNTMRRIQEQQLHLAWIDWYKDECTRTGCKKKSHYHCDDRYVARDYPAIVSEIAKHNETRPKFAPLKLVHSVNTREAHNV